MSCCTTEVDLQKPSISRGYGKSSVLPRVLMTAGAQAARRLLKQGSKRRLVRVPAYGPDAYATHRVMSFDLLTEIFVETNGGDMLSWAIAFLVIGIVAAIFGFTGIAGTAVNIAWILAVLGIILFVVFLVLGRRPPV